MMETRLESRSKLRVERMVTMYIRMLGLKLECVMS